jgi:hypothetical protein
LAMKRQSGERQNLRARSSRTCTGTTNDRSHLSTPDFFRGWRGSCQALAASLDHRKTALFGHGEGRAMDALRHVIDR